MSHVCSIVAGNRHNNRCSCVNTARDEAAPREETYICNASLPGLAFYSWGICGGWGHQGKKLSQGIFLHLSSIGKCTLVILGSAGGLRFV